MPGILGIANGLGSVVPKLGIHPAKTRYPQYYAAFKIIAEWPDCPRRFHVVIDEYFTVVAAKTQVIVSHPASKNSSRRGQPDKGSDHKRHPGPEREEDARR